MTGLIVADWQDAKLSAVASLLQSEFLTTQLQPIVKVVTLAMRGVVTTSYQVVHFLGDDTRIGQKNLAKPDALHEISVLFQRNGT